MRLVDIYISIISNIAKLGYYFLKITNIGAGKSYPGYFVLNLHKNYLIENKFKFDKGIIFVTGTNGKTTTTNIISSVLKDKGYRVLTNSTGANLINGLTSCLVLGSDLLGKVTYDFGVFEVDEFTLPVFSKYIKPDVVVCLNLSRDQLDRHWETDIIMDKWQEAFLGMEKTTSFIFYSGQKEFEKMKQFLGETYYFDDNKKLLSNSIFISNFNAKNLNAGFLALHVFGISESDFVKSLPYVGNAFGRGENVSCSNVTFSILLAKNPASQNENLKHLKNNLDSYDGLLFVLNDNIPDGHDVSWIYDVDPELLTEVSKNKTIFVSGTRAFDMAIRLNYAGVNVLKENISENLKGIISLVSKQKCSNVVILPNYSAMLAVRKILLGRKIL